MEAYGSADYSTSAEQLMALLSEDPEDHKLRIYAGVSLLQLNQSVQAIKILKPAATSDEKMIAERALWYLGMAYLMEEDGAAARESFESLRDRKGSLEPNAKVLLEKIQKMENP